MSANGVRRRGKTPPRNDPQFQGPDGESIWRQACHKFYRTGWCERNHCRKDHYLPHASVANSKNAHCREFVRGQCHLGDRCRFYHQRVLWAPTSSTTQHPPAAPHAVPPQAITAGDHDLCLLCFTDRADRVAVRCGHMCLCGPCSVSLSRTTNKCPKCRATVTYWMQVFRN